MSLFELCILLFCLSAIRWNRSKRSISFPSHKFWSLVQAQDKPIILLATKGYVFKKLCYVFPYNGVFFFTDAGKMEAPDGVTLVGTDYSFSIQ